MEFEYRKLRGKIVEKYNTISAFSDVIGVTAQSVSAKLNGKSQFNQEDIILWCRILDIELCDAHSYFFD